MESFLDELQNEVESIKLTPDQEDTIFLALAGLKQVSLSNSSSSCECCLHLSLCLHAFLVILLLPILYQVRDLLLHKLPFSGELPDYESLTLADYGVCQIK